MLYILLLAMLLLGLGALFWTCFLRKSPPSKKEKEDRYKEERRDRAMNVRKRLDKERKRNEGVKGTRADKAKARIIQNEDKAFYSFVFNNRGPAGPAGQSRPRLAGQYDLDLWYALYNLNCKHRYNLG
jgi:hypothetical protein